MAAGGRLRGRGEERGGSAGRLGGGAALRGVLLPLLEGGGTPFVCHPAAGEERGPSGDVAVTGWVPQGWTLTSVPPASGMATCTSGMATCTSGVVTYTSGTFTSGMATCTSRMATYTSGVVTCLRDGHLRLRNGH